MSAPGIEYVLLNVKTSVCLFKMPPLSTSKGYYLDDWKEMFWEGIKSFQKLLGGVKLIEQSGNLSLQFANPNDGQVVATSPLPDNPWEAVQKTVDSQRGYAVRLTLPTGQYQWVGCVFRERNDAFDLSDRISKFIEDRDRERNPNKYKNEFQPTKDFSLKQGEKISLSLEGAAASQKRQTNGQPVSLNAFKFAPLDDGSSNAFQSQTQTIQQTSFSTSTTTQATSDFNSWGSFASFGQPIQSAQQAPVQNQWSWGQPTQPAQNQYSFSQPQQQVSFQQQSAFQPQPVQQQVTFQAQSTQQQSSNTVNLLDL